MRRMLNPIAEGRALAGETMMRAYPRVFSLINDNDIAKSKLSRARCDVFIKLENPADLLKDKNRMVSAYQHMKKENSIGLSRFSLFGMGLVFASAATTLATAKSAIRAIAEVFVLVIIVKLGYGVLKRLAFITEMKRLLKIAIDAIEKHPGGVPTIEVQPIPATSSGTRQ